MRLNWSEAKKARLGDPLLNCPPYNWGYAARRLRAVPPPFDYVTVDVVDDTLEVCVSVWTRGVWEIWGLPRGAKKWKLAETVVSRSVLARMKCKQCGTEQNPVQTLMGPVCGKCARENQKRWTEDR